MSTLWELSKIFFSAFSYTFLTYVFWIVVFLVYLMYKRTADLERRLFGRVINGLRQQMLHSLGLGIAGGLLASALLIFLGLSLEQIGLAFIWPVAILLVFINPRLFCFAYAGGIVALAVLAARALARYFPVLTTIPLLETLLRVHIPAMLVLIGLLHLLEALLIFAGGHRGCTPLYLKKPTGEVVGGFSLQRFWPMPLVVLLVSVVLKSESTGVNMPAWWPILKPALQPGINQTLLYMPFPLAAGLGYADLALSSSPREKAAMSARHLALYSLTLLALAVAASYYPLLTLPAVLLAPLGHEALVVYGSRSELSGQPRYQPPSRGVRLLMVLPDSPAAAAGLREGDIICRVNGQEVNEIEELVEKIEASYFMVLLEVERQEQLLSMVLRKRTGERAAAQHPAYGMRSAVYRGTELGLISVPSTRSPVYVEIAKPSLLGFIKKKLRLPGSKI